MNRVWIELERPSHEQASTVGEQRAKLANAMMKKLGCSYEPFEWMESEWTYIHSLPDNAGFIYLKDSGEWFNLDKLSE